MKILVVNYDYPPLGGGGAIACEQLAEEFAKEHDITVLTTAFKKHPKFEVKNNIKIYRVPVINRKEINEASFISMLTFIPMGLLKGISLCKKERFDLIYTWFVLPSGITSAILSKLFKIPHAVTIIGGDIYDPSKKMSPHRHAVLKKLVRWVINSAGIKTSISTDVKNRVLKYYKTGQDIVVLPLGFKKPEFKKAKRKDLGLNEKDFYIVSVGRFVKRKGYEYLIRAFSRLDDKANLIMMGEGPEEENLKKLAKKLGVLDRIIFPGFVSDEKKFQYLANSDLFVLPSLHEGFGIVFQEAMLCRLPIVATDIGGQTDFLKHGRNALLCPVEDYVALAKAMDRLIKNKNLRLKMGNNNLHDLNNYYIENVSQQYLKLFER